MARGVTLGVLINRLRIKAGRVSTPALGQNERDSYVETLQDVQRTLWDDYDWPHLRVKRDIATKKSQRFYNAPQDLPTYRINREPDFKWGDVWNTLNYRIYPRHDFTMFDSDRGEESWPVQKWDVVEDPDATAGTIDDVGLIELWPIPSQDANDDNLDGYVRLQGIRRIREMVAESDLCELDADLLVLYAAAEIQGQDQNPMAGATLQLAQRRFAKLKGRASHMRTFSMIGPDEHERFVIGPPWPRRVVSNS